MYVFMYVWIWVGVCFYYIMNNHEINTNVKARNVTISISIYSFQLLLILSCSIFLLPSRNNTYPEFCFHCLLAFFKNSVITYVLMSVKFLFSFSYMFLKIVWTVIFQDLLIPFSIITALLVIYIHINLWRYAPFIAIFNITSYKYVIIYFLVSSFLAIKNSNAINIFFLLVLNTLWPYCYQTHMWS